MNKTLPHKTFRWLGMLCLSILIATSAFAQHPYPSEQIKPPTLQQIFDVKETFKYEVKYGFLKLGWVEVELLSDTTYNSKTLKHMVTRITSNARIPLVGTEIDYFHSLFFVNDDGIPVTEYYWKDNIDEDKYKDIEYSFDREEMVVRYKEEDETRDTLALVEPATAGQVIFYYGRMFAGSGFDRTLPVYVTKKLGYIHMKNPKKVEMRNYAPWEESVATYKMEGSTENIDGPFGFSGNFRAWYLTDDLRVPLEARVKVLFGNTIIRLIEYNRMDR